jgi:steroid 5-alpha reductase family enzyme
MNAPFVPNRPWRDFAVVTLAYLVGFVVAGAVVNALPAEWHPIAVFALADVAATVAVFAFSFANDNTSFYDPYWSVAPVVIAVWLALGPGAARGLDARQVAVLALVTLYGMRLTFNWARGWAGIRHEDWRYVEFRQKTGKAYWLVSLSALHLFPTVMVLLGCLPLHAALVAPATPFGLLDVVAVVVTLAAIVIEALADEQLRAFRRSKRADGDICTVGLWSWSRHPNYFGEMSFWFGLWLFGVANGAPWWAALGWVAMVVMFVGATIPMAEKRSLSRRPHYADHQKRVSMVLPLPPKKAPASEPAPSR